MSENSIQNHDVSHDISIDILRIFCCFNVILLHASAHIYYVYSAKSAEWIFANACNAFTRFSVPVFVMISGAMFLSPKRAFSIAGFWKKHVLRLFIIYLVWCAIYGTFTYLRLNDVFNPKAFVKAFLENYYHLWYLPMLLGIYALVPILRKMVMVFQKADYRYFLLLFFVFQICLTTFLNLSSHKILNNYLDDFTLPMVCSYVGYFILGHYLYSEKTFTKLQKVLIYISWPVCYLANVALSTFYAWRHGEPNESIIDSYGIFTFFVCIAIFVLFTKQFKTLSPEGKRAKIIMGISKSTLGIYLCHLLIMDSPWFSNALHTITPFVIIPVVTILTFIIGLVFATLLRKIPFIGKYIC